MSDDETVGDADRDTTDSDVECAATGSDAERAATGSDAERATTDDDAERATADGDLTQEDESTPRHDRVRGHRTPGPLNSLQYWTDAKSPLRVAVNYLVVWIVRISPSLRLKNWLLRRIGVTVGEGVSWGLEATPDVFWPEHITLGDHAIVGYDATLLCHEFLQEEYRVGDVVIGERAMIGAGAIVLPGVEIGDRAQVAANSLVTRDVPPGATVAGVPAREMTEENASDAYRDSRNPDGDDRTDATNGSKEAGEDRTDAGDD